MDNRPTFGRVDRAESPAELRRSFHRWQRLSATDVARPRRSDLDEARLQLASALDRVGRYRSHEVSLPRVDIGEVQDAIDELRATAVATG
jgi:hypothetical protein